MPKRKDIAVTMPLNTFIHIYTATVIVVVQQAITQPLVLVRPKKDDPTGIGGRWLCNLVYVNMFNGFATAACSVCNDGLLNSNRLYCLVAA